jgi:cyclopropane-fatty-acyl-phospholipid synthase
VKTIMSDGNDRAAAGRTGASADAIKAHYDRGEDFFSLILDPELVYSSALFEGKDDKDLTAAQLRKLDHHIEAAGATNAGRVLDIGCGWGSMLRRLVGHAGAKTAVGLTLSSSQAEWVRGHAQPGMQILEQDWRDHRPDQPYDAIISIGAFEHFVHKGLDPARKLGAYRDFFAFCDRVLVDDARLSLQTIAYSEPHKGHPVLERAFPDSDLPLFWEPIAAAEGRFEIVRLRNDSEDYYRTLRIWEQNLMNRRTEALALIGEAAFDEFRQYLRLSAAAFRTGATGLLRMSFKKKH